VEARKTAPATDHRKARGTAAPGAKVAFFAERGNGRDAETRMRANWQLLADAGHLDILTAGLESLKEQMGNHRRDGNATMVRIYERRISDVRRIIKAAR
jgi:hypothetical protein